MNKRVKYIFIKICVCTIILLQPLSSIAQLQSLENGNYLIFPNWSKGDSKIIKSKTINTTISNGDTIVVQSISNSKFVIDSQTDVHYTVSVRDLDYTKDSLNIVKEEIANDIIKNENYEKTLEYLFENTIVKILESYNKSETITYLVDKWGYYKGLNESFQLDSFKHIFKNELLKTTNLELLDSQKINELIETIEVDELHSILSETFYEQINSLHMPYDIELKMDNTLSDTLNYLIPWFSEPVSCLKNVSMTHNEDEIEIRIAFDYLIDSTDYLNVDNPVTLSFFELNISSKYILDYKTKWVKNIYSRTVRKENNKVFLENYEAIVKNAM